MLSKNELKFLRSLQQKKYRKEYQQFLVEGTKSVKEVIESDFVVKKVFAGQKWIEPIQTNCR
jgi:TrmH family RNA methyltransferase